MPTLQCSSVRSSTARCSVARVCLGIVGGDPDERLIPPEHLHDGSWLGAQGRHHLVRRGVVGGGIHRQDHRIGNLARGDPQRHPRPDTVLARLVRRRRDDCSLGGIAASADDHRLAGEFRMPQHLDGGDELVEVDVKHPPTRHRRSWEQSA